MHPTIYDIAGIGIGPFNLGMAALVEDIPKLSAVFFDKKPSFTWHEGMMIKGTHLQVPFYADLVTLINPQSRYTFLNYLKATGRMLQFAMRDNLYPSRLEYTKYCQWVASQLSSLCFGYEVMAIEYDNTLLCYRVTATGRTHQQVIYRYARKIIIGIGTIPSMPAGISGSTDNILHAAYYCYHKEKILQRESVCVVGSGQSAAEIFYDLLQYQEKFTKGLTWISRSDRIFPMDYSSFSLEMSSPAYIRHFFRLPETARHQLNQEQKYLYKGINASLIEAIYTTLYTESLHGNTGHIRIILNCNMEELQRAENNIVLRFRQLLTGNIFSLPTETAIFATGYQYRLPEFINPVRNRILFTGTGKYAVNENYAIDAMGNEIFVQNAEMHTHGFNAPDLGLGPYRNSIILNTVLGYELFKPELHTTFQVFE